KEGRLRFCTSDAIKLKLVPPTPDVSKYTHLEMHFNSNREGDHFRFTITANPPDAKKWNYYYAPIQSIVKGMQKITIDLTKLNKARNPLGKDKVQTLDFNFTGWEMPYKKGLVLDIEKIVLIKKAVAPVAAGKKVSVPEFEELKQLPAAPWIPVPDASDRKFWDAKCKTLFGKNTLKHAQNALNTPAVAPPTDYYLDFLRNGNRRRYEQLYQPLVRNYSYLTMALCLTGDKEKYFKQWHAYNDVLCNMVTWVYPAHDKQLDNLLMRRHHIELVGSNTGLTVITARRLLAPWISPETAKKMQAAVTRQLITPMVETAQGKRQPDWFLSSTNNWNAVCIANMVQVLLASDLPRDVRNSTIAFAVRHTGNYLQGFNADGYCSEGISYWGYGFGHYLRLAATLYAVSKGKIQLLSIPEARLAAQFPEKFMLSKNQYFPAFSDCYFNAGVSEATLYLRDFLLGHHAGAPDQVATNMLGQLAVWGLPVQSGKTAKKFVPEMISAFEKTGVFIFRHPAENGILLACKGGNNAELHNHNDVGSFTIAFPGTVALLGDLGGVIYSRDSFNHNRYKNPLLNSWGHPVPVIGGRLQISGPGTAAKKLRFVKQKNSTSVTLDIRNAYGNHPAGIKKLERTFSFNSEGRGKVSVADSAEFENPQSFETALTTFGRIKRTGKDTLSAEYRNTNVSITVNTSGIPWKLKHETIKADSSWKDRPQRYAIELEGSHKKINMEMIFIPTHK
ncbi:MAG: hypothetical protein J6S54_08220, partial [Lentisphaeria bacterium]|nr:hypothetical protein [Lentisphaeria bacterium]